MGEAKDFRETDLPLVWKPVAFGDQNPSDLHKRPIKYHGDRERLEGPQVYRWVLRSPTGIIEKVYVGQCGSLVQRVSDYRSKRRVGATEFLVRTEIDECESKGGSATLEVLHLESPFKICGVKINKLSFGDEEIRVMLENLMIASAKAEGLQTINRTGKNVIEARILDLAGNLERSMGRKGIVAAFAKVIEEIRGLPAA